MKSGSGEDPFADFDETADEATDDKEDEETEPSVEETTTETTSSGTSGAATNLPWKYARENVKSDRDMVQFYLQAETKSLESQAEADLEGILDESVLTFDLREAAYQVALQQHLDDVADQLREWGYDAK
jgi:hypothetical protein